MAFCGKCGQQVNDGVKFCPTCGESIRIAIIEEPVQAVQAEEPSKPTGDNSSGKLGNLNNTADNTSDFDKTDIEQNKVMALLSYLGILVLIPIFAAKESKFARFHANQGLVLCIVWFAWIIADSILTAIFRAIFWRGLGMWGVYSLCATLLNLVYIVFTVLAIIGIINALNGRAKELPVIGKYKILK